jgi:hypothetical protein
MQKTKRWQRSPRAGKFGAPDWPDAVQRGWLPAVAQEVGIGIDLLLAPCLVGQGRNTAGENLRHSGCAADRGDHSPKCVVAVMGKADGFHHVKMLASYAPEGKSLSIPAT